MHTDSRFVAQEVVELLGAPAERVRAVHLGVLPAGDERSAVAGGVPAAAGGPPAGLPRWVTAYVLALGTIEPRKDLPTLVRAFGLIAGRLPGLALVLAEARGVGARRSSRMRSSPAPPTIGSCGSAWPPSGP